MRSCRILAKLLHAPTVGQASELGIDPQVKRPIPYLRTRWARVWTVFEIGTIVSYRGRLYVVVCITPMSVTPPLVELEDTESGRIRRVRGDDPQLVIEATRRLPADDE